MLVPNGQQTTLQIVAIPVATKTLNSNVSRMVEEYLVQGADLCCVTSVIATNEKHRDETVHADHNDPSHNEFSVVVDSNLLPLGKMLFLRPHGGLSNNCDIGGGQNDEEKKVLSCFGQWASSVGLRLDMRFFHGQDAIPGLAPANVI